MTTPRTRISSHSHPPGLLQISSLALLQQGKVGAASAQLCACLKQGGQRTEEACAAVRSFLLALHAHVGASISTGAGAAACAGAATKAAAGARVQDGRAGRGAGAAPPACSAEERAAAVQQVAASAAEHCKTEPAVALEVAMQLLSDPVSDIVTVSVASLSSK